LAHVEPVAARTVAAEARQFIVAMVVTAVIVGVALLAVFVWFIVHCYRYGLIVI